jgi:hypothetical protein
LHPLHDLRPRSRRPGLAVTGSSRGRVAQTSGHRVLRTLLRPSTDAARLGRSISLIKNSIKESGLLSEWHGEHFVAIDVPPGTDMSPVFALLQREVDEADAFWEWTDAMPFSTTRS